MVVSASTAQATHGPADDPVLVMTIKNAGTTDCMVNVGTSQQDFSVTSGEDHPADLRTSVTHPAAELSSG